MFLNYFYKIYLIFVERHIGLWACELCVASSNNLSSICCNLAQRGNSSVVFDSSFKVNEIIILLKMNRCLGTNTS